LSHYNTSKQRRHAGRPERQKSEKNQQSVSRIAKAPRALHPMWALPGPHMAAATDWLTAASFRSRPPNPLAFDDANCKCLLVQGYSDTNGTGAAYKRNQHVGPGNACCFLGPTCQPVGWASRPEMTALLINVQVVVLVRGARKKIWVDPVSSQNLCILPLDGGHVDRRQIIRSSSEAPLHLVLVGCRYHRLENQVPFVCL